ncbi:carboxypeptidase regulatory-like domain-containing protein [Candidatus Bathyarchaeota archaeon]|nr:carboxypeptidase regulatory-like domain-containing protein [Candidatus Bathyarchaeota archaeon]
MKHSNWTGRFVITVLLISSFFLLSVNADTAGNIHGTLLDERGSPIEDVKITAVLSNGDHEGPFYSDEEGYFRLWLWGSYTLTFEKEGYVTAQRGALVEQSPKFDPDQDLILGDIVLDDTIALSSSVLKRLTTPGNELRFEFTVSNRGDETEDITFRTGVPEGWDVKILDTIGEIENIRLEPGSKIFDIEITVPETATNSEVITVTATGTSTATLDFAITPKVYTDEIKLISTYLSVSEEKGQNIELPLTVSNVGEVDKKVALSGIIPVGWSMTFRTSTGMSVKTLLLSSGQSESLTIELETVDDVSIGAYDIIVTATDVNGAVLDTLELDVSLSGVTSEIDVISSFSEVSVEAGSSITFPLVVWNKGEADALTLFTVPDLPRDWDTSFIVDDLEIASIRIPGGESEAVELIVRPPNSVTSDIYDMTVVIESDDGTEHELGFIIEVVGSYELELELSTLYTISTIGGSVSYSGTVKNLGQTAVTTLYLDAVLPADWVASITPTQVSSLEPRDSVTFTVDVELPGDTEAGDYLVTTQAISDQMESDEIDVRITAQASNTWGYIGIGIAIISVAGAALLFKRFKRR